MTSKHPVNALVNIDDLRPGVVINFGAPGPEWFLRDDGTLITMNGIAGSACDGLMDVPAAIGRQLTASAPKRGDSAKTYEGTYDRDGNFLHPDCSEFEIRIGRIYHQALWKDPEASDEQAGRHAAKAAKQAGVKREVAEAIYGKTASVCIQAITSP